MGYLNAVAGAARDELNTTDFAAAAGQAEANSVLVVGDDLAISGLRRVVNLAAVTQTLTVAQSGEKFVGVADAVFTLPEAADENIIGVTYEFECGDAGGSVGISISPGATTHIRGNGLTSVNDKDLINTAATDRLGDMVRVYADSSANWVIDAIIGTWAKEA